MPCFLLLVGFVAFFSNFNSSFRILIGLSLFLEKHSFCNVPPTDVPAKILNFIVFVFQFLLLSNNELLVSEMQKHWGSRTSFQRWSVWKTVNVFVL